MNRALLGPILLLGVLAVTMYGTSSLSVSAAQTAWTIAVAALTVLVTAGLLSRYRLAGDAVMSAGAASVVAQAPPESVSPPADTRPRRAIGKPALIEQMVLVFQEDCSRLLLDAEAARVQTESCEGGVRALGDASRSLATTCDVLGRRAGLAQSHALMARCATVDALQGLHAAVDRTRTLRGRLAADVATGHAGTVAGIADALLAELGQVQQSLDAALERGDEAARVAASLGGAAARGEQHAQWLGEACTGLAPSLQESARTGLRLAMLAAGLEDSAGRVARMFEATAAGRQWTESPARPGVATAEARPPDTQADGNVVWVRFPGVLRDGPDAEHG